MEEKAKDYADFEKAMRYQLSHLEPSDSSILETIGNTPKFDPNCIERDYRKIENMMRQAKENGTF